MIILSFLLQFQSTMEAYSNKYIINPFTEQSLLRALANESLIKARRERAQQTALAIQRLFEYHPALVTPGHVEDRLSPAPTPTSVVPHTPSASVSDIRRGSLTSRSVASTQQSTEGSTQQHRRSQTSAVGLFDCQLMERESRVLAHIRRKLWLNLRFEYVRASPTALWFLPYVKYLPFGVVNFITSLQ